MDRHPPENHTTIPPPVWIVPVSSRRGRFDATSLLAVGSVVIAAALILGLVILGRRDSGLAKPLILFCAAGLRQPTEEIVEAYREECGVQVQVQYGGSNTLLGQIEAGGMGDLFLVAEDVYADMARQRGLAQEVIPVAVQRPVICVRKGNPRRIAGLGDLLRADVRVGLANPDQAAIGRATKEVLERAGRWKGIEREVTRHGVFKPTVNDLVNDVKLGTIDASIVWDALVRQDSELEIVKSKELESGAARIAICVLTSAKTPTAALRFARYLAAGDRGLPVFASTGFEVVEGDTWAATPQLTFYAGIVARQAIEEAVRAFSEREGIVVNTVYNGCGILTGQMLAMRDKKLGGFPDIYLAGDLCYIENVKDCFQETTELSETGIVMVVAKGNPKGLRELGDLTREGVRVVIGQPKQCTIGVLTRQMLQEKGVHEQVMKNVVSEMATSGLLVPAVTTGSCDVALAWHTDVTGESGRLDSISIDSKHGKAVQTLAIARSSERKELARRLFRAIVAARPRFESAGFTWRMSSPPAAPTPVSGHRSH